MDDKKSDRGSDAPAHKRHGRTMAGAAIPSNSRTSAGPTASTASALSSMLRRYAPTSIYRKAKVDHPPLASVSAGSTSAAGASSASAATSSSIYTIRDRTDATAKRAFRVQIPVRLMSTVWAVFLVVPILIFGWKETHWSSQQGSAGDATQLRTASLRRSDARARQDSNWMEDHLLAVEDHRLPPPSSSSTGSNKDPTIHLGLVTNVTTTRGTDAEPAKSADAKAHSSSAGLPPPMREEAADATVSNVTAPSTTSVLGARAGDNVTSAAASKDVELEAALVPDAAVDVQESGAT